MWEELLETIGKFNGKFRGYLDALQMSVVGYIDPDTGWDLNIIDQWFNECGYDYIGELDLFDETNPSDIYIEVEGIVWRSHSNTHDNTIYWYFDPDMYSEGMTLDDLRFHTGNAKQFIWDQDEQLAYIVNIDE